MALKTVEKRKKVLHTTDNQNRKRRRAETPAGSTSRKSVPPGESPADRSGEMTDSSSRFFVSPDREEEIRPTEPVRESGKSKGKDTGGKILHTAARKGFDAMTENVEGGEEVRESEQILAAMGSVGKKIYRHQKQKKMKMEKYARVVVGSTSGRSQDSGGSPIGQSVKSEISPTDSKKAGRRSKTRHLREKQYHHGKRRYGHYRRRRKHDEDDTDEEPTPIGIRERLIHAFRVRDAKEDSAGTLGSVTKGTKGLKRLIKIILFLIKKLITLLLLPIFIILGILILLIALIVGVLLLIIYCSPLSIFFPLPDTGTEDIRTVLSSYYQEFNAKISSYEANGDSVTYQNSKDGVVTVNFKDTLMVYLTLYADGAPGFIMDDQGRANLKKVFDEMNYIDEGRNERQIKVGDSLGKVFVTAYCPCRECSGRYGHSTASGARAKPNHTIAVDAYDPIVPMGTKVVIEGKVYTVEDTGDLHKYGNEFDIFYEHHSELDSWGRKKVEVFLADKDGKINNPDTTDDNGTDRGEPDDDNSGSNKGNSDGNTVTVRSQGITVHNLTWEDYIAAHPELNDDQKKMLQMLMEEQTSYYGGGGDIGVNVVQLGMTKLGCHYSQDRRFDEGYYDCSSFALRLYAEFGLELPGTAAEQGRFCVEHGMVLNFEDLRPGDLIFYSYETNGRYRNISHVAIYAGDGNMIHAANPRRGVVMDPIRTSSVVFYGRPYMG